MIDKTTFMETLRSVQDIAKTSENPLSREEIQSYFEGMELSLEQQEMIYQYLLQPDREPAEERKEESQGKRKVDKTAGSKNKKHSLPFQMYLREINGIPALSEEERQLLYQRLFAGEKEVISGISHQWLRKIAETAESYAGGKALLEDLVQEGSMGLLLGLEQLVKEQEESAGEIKQKEIMSAGVETVEKRLELFVKEAMESFCQEMESADYNENTILAKVNLIHEAQKMMAEENGTIPTMQELSQYTRIPVEEIRDILSLASKD